MTTDSNATRIPATVGTGKAVHAAIDRHDGYGLGIDCGAVRYRNTTARSITRQRAGTEVTCTKCLARLAPTEAEAPAAEETLAELLGRVEDEVRGVRDGRVYASKLRAGDRVDLRHFRGVEVDKVIGWAPRKVLVTLVGGQQLAMGSWTWVRLV